MSGRRGSRVLAEVEWPPATGDSGHWALVTAPRGRTRPKMGYINRGKSKGRGI